MFQFIYRKQTVQSPPPDPQNSQTYRQCSAQLSRHNCTSKIVTALCWGRGGKYYHVYSPPWTKSYKNIAGKLTGTLAAPAAERPSHSASAKQRLLLNLGLEAPVQLPFLIVHLTQDHVVLQEKLVSHAEPGR